MVESELIRVSGHNLGESPWPEVDTGGIVRISNFSCVQIFVLASFGLAAASLFPVILLCISSKRVNNQGAIAGMLVGLIFTYAYIEYFKGLFLKWAGSPWGENIADHWLFGISPEGIGVVGMCLNFTVAISVSCLTKPPPEYIRHMVEQIRVPR